MFRWLLIFCLGTMVLGRAFPDSLTGYNNWSGLFDFSWFKFHLPKTSEERKSELAVVCETVECKELGKFILSNMNRSVNPCDDFYEYACGNWVNSNPIPPWAIAWDLWSIPQENTRFKIRDILLTKTKPNDIQPLKLVKRWYKACMDEVTLNARGVAPIELIVSEIGGWPMAMESGKWNSFNYTWVNVEKYYAKMIGLTSFTSYRLIPSGITEKFNKTTLMIGDPVLPLKDSLPDRKMLYLSDHYKLFIMKAANKIAKEKAIVLDQKKLAKDVDDLINFEKELYKIQTIENTEPKENRKKMFSADDNSDKNKDEKRILKSEVKKNRSKANHKKEKDITAVTRNKRKIKHRTNTANTNRVRKPMRDVEKISQNHPNSLRKKRKREISRIFDKTKNSKNILTSKNIFSAIHRRRRTPGQPLQWNDLKSQDFEQQLEEITLRFGQNNKQGMDNQAKKIESPELLMIWMNSSENKSDTNDSYENDSSDGTSIPCNQLDYPENEDLSSIQIAEEMFNEIDFDLTDIPGAIIMSEIKFDKYIRLIQKTPKEIIVNYIQWNFISGLLRYTSDDMRNMQFQIWKHFYGFSEKAPRWKSCIDDVELIEAITFEYLKKYYDKSSGKVATDMINVMKTAIKFEIETSTWMNDDMKKMAREKVDKMKENIGYPDWYDHGSIIESEYEGLNLGSQHFENALAYKKYAFFESLRSMLNGEFKLEPWLLSKPTEINAAYIPIFNTLNVNAADFQSPIFSTSHPDAVNFGIIGYLFSHEISHGFDPTGRRYDGNGQSFEWDKSMDKEYMKRVECFVKQYSSYSLKAGNVTVKANGNKTLGENVADNTGIHSLYKAFKIWKKDKKTPDHKLPGLEDLTEDQLFFLSTATAWCESVRPAEVINQLESDVHSTGRIRVLGGLSNSEEFSKAFSCPIGSKMNPEEKCNIWK
ncbi:membrane metallo-endopeptidase-like 1 isoform X2 [Prorops nasuta]|uniref:membrane metallo-endopeptidase-like 1 isoform X2 n=1 Tax=Prorops nasuta TaxID=863751 RepID=UPI0034D02100